MSTLVTARTSDDGALRHQSISGGGFSVAAKMVNYLVQMASTVVLARMLTPADFGLVAMVHTFVAVFLVFQDFGIVDAVIQQPELDQQQLSRVFWITIGLSLIITGVVIAGSPLVSRFFSDSRLTGITILYGTCFPFIGVSVLPMALMKRKMQFGRVAVIEVAANAVSVLVAIGLAIAGAGYWSIVSRPVALAASRTIGTWIGGDWTPSSTRGAQGIASLMRFGANSSGYFLMNYVARNIDKILIGQRYGSGELGYYDRAFQLFLLPIGQITIPLHHVVVSTLARLRDDPQKLRRWFLRAVRLMGFTGFGLCLYLVAASEDVVRLLLGEQWSRTARIFMILGIGATMQLLYTSCGWLHSALGRADRWLRWGVLAAVLTAAAVSISLPFGAEWVALAYTGVLFLMTLPALLYAGSPVNLTAREVLDATWRYFLSSLMSAGITRGLLSATLQTTGPFIRLLVSAPVFLGLYLGFAVVLYRAADEVRRDIRTLSSVFEHRPTGAHPA